MNVTHSPPNIPTSNPKIPVNDTQDDVDQDEVDRMKQIEALLHTFPDPDEKATTRKGKQNPLTAIFSAITLLTEQVKGLRSDIGATRNDISETNKKIDDTLARVCTLEEDNKELNAKATQLETRVATLESGTLQSDIVQGIESRLDEIEQRTMHSKLILSTVEPIQLVQDTRHQTSAISSYLTENLQIPANELVSISAHQMGNTKKKFTIDVGDPDLRYKLFAKCRTLRPQGFFLSEFLTKKRHKLLYDIRKLRESTPNLKKIFTNHGRIFIVVDGLENPKPVDTLDDVKNCCNAVEE